jgi:GMP synthase PP-ATPase subunit
VLDITGEIALSKTPLNEKDKIVDAMKAALNLPMDTQMRSDALLDVLVKIVDVCFKKPQVRRDFLQKFQEESSEYGVKPLETQDGYNDAD